MGAIDLSTSAGVDRYADWANTTRDVIMNDTDVTPRDQMFASNAGNKDKAVSGVLVEMLAAKKTMSGGLGMTGVDLVNLPKMQPVDAMADQPDVAMPQLTDSHKIPHTATFFLPIITYQKELEINNTESQIKNMIKTKIYAALLAGSVAMIRNWYGNNTSYYDPKLDPTNAAVPASFVNWTGNYLPFCGLGYGDSSVANTIMGTQNNYAMYNRALPKYDFARAKVHTTSALTVAANGVVPFSTWGAMTMDHLDFITDECAVGLAKGKIITVPKLGMRAIKSLFRAKQYQINYDVALLKVGIEAIEFNGCKIIVDRNFHHPLQLDVYNPEFTYIDFVKGMEPKISNAVPLWGKLAVGQQFTFTCQSWAEFPGLHSRFVIG